MHLHTQAQRSEHGLKLALERAQRAEDRLGTVELELHGLSGEAEQLGTTCSEVRQEPTVRNRRRWLPPHICMPPQARCRCPAALQRAGYHMCAFSCVTAARARGYALVT
jgi:hypothetical protein